MFFLIPEIIKNINNNQFIIQTYTQISIKELILIDFSWAQIPSQYFQQFSYNERNPQEFKSNASNKSLYIAIH